MLRVRIIPVWCGKRDLNPYGVNHTPLKRARLPVPPLPRVRLTRNILYYTRFFQNVKTFFEKNQNFYQKFSPKTLDKTIPIVYNIEVVNRRHNLRVCAEKFRHTHSYSFAGMAELADALDSGSSGGNFVEVQVLLPAPNSRNPNPKPVGEGFGFLFVFGDM